MTSLGGDLEVDGTVTARQATQAGQAVVLGNDLTIPSSMLKLGPGLGVTSDGKIYIPSLVGTVNISQATGRLSGQGKYYNYAITGMDIPAATLDGTPHWLTACNGDVGKGDTVYPHSERSSTLNLPVGPADEVTVSSVGKMGSAFFTVTTEDNIALCDAVEILFSN